MRIIVGNDYYDNVMSYGHDDHVTFVREKDHTVLMEDIILRRNYISFYAQPVKKSDVRRFTYANVFYVKDTRYDIRPICVIFCGKRYSGVKVTCSDDVNSWFFWDFEKFQEFLNDRGHYLNSSRRPSAWDLRSKDGEIRYYSEEYFEVRECFKEEMDYLIANRITIMSNDGDTIKDYRGEFWRINPYNLKDMQFYKAVDAYTAFQEIEMWIGGILPAQGNPMVVITDDKVKAEKHGFDKWSFRRHKCDP